jgi:hypothetical protein
MKTVNPFFLCKLLGPLVGLADDDDALDKYHPLDPNDPEQVRVVIRDELAPHFLAMSADGKARARLALNYYLSNPRLDFGRVMDSSLLPFESPADPRTFFVLLWEELFPGEVFVPIGVDDYREVPNIHEPNRY